MRTRAMPSMPTPAELSSYLRLPPATLGLGLIAGAGPSRRRGTKGTGVLGSACPGITEACGAAVGPPVTARPPP